MSDLIFKKEVSELDVKIKDLQDEREVLHMLYYKSLCFVSRYLSLWKVFKINEEYYSLTLSVFAPTTATATIFKQVMDKNTIEKNTIEKNTIEKNTIEFKVFAAIHLVFTDENNLNEFMLEIEESAHRLINKAKNNNIYGYMKDEIRNFYIAYGGKYSTEKFSLIDETITEVCPEVYVDKKHYSIDIDGNTPINNYCTYQHNIFHPDEKIRKLFISFNKTAIKY